MAIWVLPLVFCAATSLVTLCLLFCLWWAASRFRRRSAVQVLVVCGLTMFLLSGLNWVICRGVAASLGGSAVIGKREGGEYFLRDHSRVVRVSEKTFNRLYAYERVSDLIFDVGFWTFPFVFLLVGVANKRRQAKAGRAQDGRDI